MENKKQPLADSILTDEQMLDDLIVATFERQELVSNINKTIMHDVRRNLLRRRLLHWARLVAFAFGIPLLLMAFLYVAISYALADEDNLLIMACMALPIITMLITCGKVIGDFSIEEV